MELSKIVKIGKQLNYQVNEFYSAVEIKKELVRLHIECGIDVIVTAADIINWYDVSDLTKTIMGKRVRGYVIKMKKIKC
jgi:hypothetical protein